MVGRYSDRTLFPDTAAGRLAYNLRRLRKTAGLSGRESADRANIQKTTWYRWEDAQAVSPDLGMLARAAEVLGADVRDLFRPVPAKYREK